MNILMLNWKDLKNPTAGGAELLTEGILAELVRRGNTVTLFCSAFPGSLSEEIIDGYTVIRKGKYYTVQFWAFVFWFRRFNKEKFDIVIDQIHGLPFFTPLYVRSIKKVAFIHEVAGDIWKEMFNPLVAYTGLFFEWLTFKLYKRVPFITVSDSTKQDLIKKGIIEKNISITPEAIIPPDAPIDELKEAIPTMIYVGRISPMKRIEHFLMAASIVAKSFPDLQVWVVGSGDENYLDKLKNIAEKLQLHKVTFWGKVSKQTKYELLKRATVLSSASVKEGFGLVLIEAGLVGTPSVVYNIAGFRDAVRNGHTGITTSQNPEKLAQAIVALINNKDTYTRMAEEVKIYAETLTFENAGREFENILSSK